MKNWVVDYSIKRTDGRVQEITEEVKADSILEAMTVAAVDIQKPALADPDVEACVIWGVVIIEDDVF